MGVRNQEFFDGSLPAKFDGLFNWDKIREKALPKFSAVDFMDIDAILERNKRFLVMETKSEKSRIPLGQQITLNNLHSLGCFTLVVLQFKNGEKETHELYRVGVKYPNDEDIFYYHSNKYSSAQLEEILIKIVRGWWEDANNKGSQTIRKDKLSSWLKLKIKLTTLYQKLVKSLGLRK